MVSNYLPSWMSSCLGRKPGHEIDDSSKGDIPITSAARSKKGANGTSHSVTVHAAGNSSVVTAMPQSTVVGNGTAAVANGTDHVAVNVSTGLTNGDVRAVSSSAASAASTATATTDVALAVLPDPIGGSADLTEVEQVQPSRCWQFRDWLTRREPGRAPVWQRAIVVGTSFASTLLVRYYMRDDAAAVAGSSLMSNVQANAETYNWSPLRRYGLLTLMYGVSRIAEVYFFPTSYFIQTVGISGLVLGLAFRTASVDLQQWNNLAAAQNKTETRKK